MKKFPLMTMDEYKAISYEKPYVIELNADGKRFCFIGTEHIRDLKHPQYDLILTKWSEFISEIDQKSTIVIVEGGKRPDYDDIGLAVKNGGEGNFISYYAKKANIETYSPEIPFTEQVEELLKAYTKDDVFYFIFLRALKIRSRRVDKLEREDLEDVLEDVKNKLSWKDFEFTLTKVNQVQNKHFNFNFITSHAQFLSDIVTPRTEIGAFTNNMALLVDTLRDQYMLNEIDRLWKENKNIFIVYGASHAVIQEKALTSIIG